MSTNNSDFGENVLLNFIITLPFTKNGRVFDVELFGTINPQTKNVVVNYELNDINTIKMNTMDFAFALKSFPVKCTDSYVYVLYDCLYDIHTINYSSHGMGTIKGKFGRLVRHNPNNKYNRVLFSFEGINEVFPLDEFSVSFTDDETAIIKQPTNHIDRFFMDNGVTASIYTSVNGIPDASSVDIHITQERYIQLTFETELDIEELVKLLSRIKKYIEFLFHQEIKFSSIKMYCNNSEDQIITDPILMPSYDLKKVDYTKKCWSDEEFVIGLQSWLSHYDDMTQVISIWEKTISNRTVSDDDLFIWRCQALELLCQITDSLKTKAIECKEPDQSYPNIRQYLIAASDVYQIAHIDKAYYMDVKDVRDALTHYNPNKTVTDTQKKNSYNVIYYYFVATFAKVVGFKCALPVLVLLPASKSK